MIAICNINSSFACFQIYQSDIFLSQIIHIFLSKFSIKAVFMLTLNYYLKYCLNICIKSAVSHYFLFMLSHECCSESFFGLFSKRIKLSAKLISSDQLTCIWNIFASDLDKNDLNL